MKFYSFHINIPYEYTVSLEAFTSHHNLQIFSPVHPDIGNFILFSLCRFFSGFSKRLKFLHATKAGKKATGIELSQTPLQKKKTYQPVIFMMMAMMIRRFMSSCISRLYSEFKFSVRVFIFPYFGAKTECMCVSVAKLSHVLTTDYRMSATLAKR